MEESIEVASGVYNRAQNLISQLTNHFGSITNTTTGEGQNWTEAGTNAELVSFLTTLMRDVNTTNGTPRAFLTWLFFDREFNLKEEASGIIHADEPDVLGEAGMMDVESPMDGFIF